MLNKTDKGRQELSPGKRTLGQRERAILLMADGKKPDALLAQLFGGQGRQLIQALLQSGHLHHPAPPASQIPNHNKEPAPAAPSKPDPRATAAKTHGEPFTGQRSLATARMFLFDLSERLFAPRDPSLAHHYRNALREARDGEAMLKVGRDIISKVETLAGSERADGISERLAKLLPEGLLAQPA
ncbi:hypothetical protein LPB72_17800 [Hydrogenophaga crassostreae]|uniref:Uncharacterized protein n=1 Tax=Hydrogenophaga crassostreae TaxID=1763535 RepID=A0A162P1R9_9BURK|nr:hypothetical protein [Hydrogenophaga crassostreae]AOW15490.1 hypothetical protein LPB072_08305 [Hydrogenophaga crassostreae]OAD40277.1 hypothetical protein LPB72_17800 [Hydrogenophaga crassostreae]